MSTGPTSQSFALGYGRIKPLLVILGLAAHIRVLGLSLEDPDAFLAALGHAGVAA